MSPRRLLVEHDSKDLTAWQAFFMAEGVEAQQSAALR